MIRLYVVRGPRGWFWDVSEWSEAIDGACMFTSSARARIVARRTGGQIYELVPTPVREKARAH